MKAGELGVGGDEAGEVEGGQAIRALNARLRGWTLFWSTGEPWLALSRVKTSQEQVCASARSFWMGGGRTGAGTREECRAG